MNLRHLGEHRLLQVSSGLIITGLLVEVATLLWFHPFAFVLFAFVATSLIALGILVYLASVVFGLVPNSENRRQAEETNHEPQSARSV